MKPALNGVPAPLEAFADPAAIERLSALELAALSARLAAAQAAVAARLTQMAAAAERDPTDGAHDGDLVDVRTAARIMGTAPSWLYRRADTLPFIVRLGGHLRFSRAGFDRFIRARQGR